MIRHKIAEMVQRVNATTAYLEHCAWRVTQGETPVADLCLLKVQATQTLEFCARTVINAKTLGEPTYLTDDQIERAVRRLRRPCQARSASHTQTPGDRLS